eukprot:6142222-Heterocapsa_arctica.AAC.1
MPWPACCTVRLRFACNGVIRSSIARPMRGVPGLARARIPPAARPMRESGNTRSLSCRVQCEYRLVNLGNSAG